MMGAAPLLLVVPASRSSRLDDDAEDTSYVFGNTPAAERFHTSYYRNGIVVVVCTLLQLR